ALSPSGGEGFRSAPSPCALSPSGGEGFRSAPSPCALSPSGGESFRSAPLTLPSPPLGARVSDPLSPLGRGQGEGSRRYELNLSGNCFTMASASGSAIICM